MDDDEPTLDEDGDEHVKITIETRGGRTNLKGESVKRSTEDPTDVEPLKTAPSGVDPVQYAIDLEMGELSERITERYPGWRVNLPRKLGAYLELIRPFTLLAPIFGGLGGSLLALTVQDFVGFDWGTLIYGVSTLVLLNAASNCMNASYDAHIDGINKPYRPIPRGLVTSDEASSLAFLLYFIDRLPHHLHHHLLLDAAGQVQEKALALQHLDSLRPGAPGVPGRVDHLR